MRANILLIAMILAMGSIYSFPVVASTTSSVVSYKKIKTDTYEAKKRLRCLACGGLKGGN